MRYRETEKISGKKTAEKFHIDAVLIPVGLFAEQRESKGSGIYY
jgi:hypothetical protein